MAVKGKQREAADYSKKVGFDELNVIAFNPTKTELEDLLNISDMKEPSYLGTYQNSATGKEFPKVAISIWLQGKESKALFNVRYNIINEVRKNKDGSKMQFINAVGNTAWAADENELKSLSTEANTKEGSRKFYKEFISRDYRPALSGEEKLYDFLQKFTNMDTRALDTELSLDTKRLFKGNFSELQELLESEFKDNTLCGCATVRAVKPTPTTEDPNPGFKEYQGMFDEFLPGGYIRYFQEGVKNRPDYVNKFIASMEGEHGCKDFYIVGPIRDYVAGEHPAMSGEGAQQATASTTQPVTAGEVIDDLPF